MTLNYLWINEEVRKTKVKDYQNWGIHKVVFREYLWLDKIILEKKETKHKWSKTLT